MEADEIVEGWDYATPLSFEVLPAIDEELFLTSTGLPSVADAEVVAIVECSSTGYRFHDRIGLEALSTGPRKELSVEPPLGTLADKVSLSLVVVLARTLGDVPTDVASQRGARLAASQRRQLRLEGTAARFPTEAVPFSSMRFPEALWAVECDLSQPEEPFSSCVRLFINTEHPRSDSLLEPASSEHQLIQSALETDLVRQLLAAAQQEAEHFRDARRQWPDGSAGAALESLADVFFGKSVDELLNLQRTDRPTFERTVQARMGLFGGGA